MLLLVPYGRSAAKTFIQSQFDWQLKMDTQIDNICKAAILHLYNKRRIRKFLSFNCTHM